MAANWAPWSLGEAGVGTEFTEQHMNKRVGKVPLASQVLVCGSGPDPESEEKPPWNLRVSHSLGRVNASKYHRGIYSKKLALANLSGPLLVTLSGPQLRPG